MGKISQFDTRWGTPEGLLIIQGWASRGLTNEEIARAINVKYSTFKEWTRKYPSLKKALQQTKELNLIRVENKLFNKCMEGDTRAIIFYLCNKGDWKPESAIASQMLAQAQAQANKPSIVITMKDDYGEDGTPQKIASVDVKKPSKRQA